jgi:site-specific DNA-methyltransferase (adenine-specific)
MIETCDYVDFLNTKLPKSVDMICTDPPYGINYQSNSWDAPDIVDWSYFAKKSFEILKDTGNVIIFCGWSNVLKTKTEFESVGFTLQNWLIYDRIKGRGAKTNFTSTREDILWFTKTSKYTFNKEYSTIKKKTGGMGLKNGNEFRSLSNVWTDISPIVPWSSERVNHPTQKPLQLGERLVRIFSNARDLVIDPFCGSGTFLLAAKNENRRYEGCDNNCDYIEITNSRLK